MLLVYKYRLNLVMIVITQTINNDEENWIGVFFINVSKAFFMTDIDVINIAMLIKKDYIYSPLP